jgi:hypothetical protein
MDKDLENFSMVMKNYSQAILTFRDQEKAEDVRLEVFLKEMQSVFEFMDTIDYSNAHEVFTKKFSPTNLAASVQLVADAKPMERYILKQYRTLLLNRLNSYTKNPKVILDLLLGYYIQFLNCLEDHSNNVIQIRQLMILSGIGIQTEASRAFADFVSGPLRVAMEQKKDEAQKLIKGQDPTNWKGQAVK